VSPRERGLKPYTAGLIALGVLAVALYLAYSGANPFDAPFRLTALIADAGDLKTASPVRVAGVNVGEEVEVEPHTSQDGEATGLARVVMDLDRAALPVREDAELQVRSRIFLEGNYFVDLSPGTSAAPAIESGGTIPAVQHGAPVQFGELLTALQSDTRDDLRSFLDEYSKALDKGGAEGFNEAIRHWEGAYRGSAIVADASQGLAPHDLSELITAQGRVFGALSQDEQALMDLVTNLNRTAGAFASEHDSLRAAIPELRDALSVGRPALQSLNQGLPSLRSFAHAALPAARSSKDSLGEQLGFMRQARRLMRTSELGGLSGQLRRAAPDLTRLNLGQIRSLQQVRALASCQNEVLLPFGRTPIPHPYFDKLSGEPFYKQSARSLVGLAGESRLSDANTPYFRTQAGGGPITIVSPGVLGEDMYSQLDFPLQGIAPLRPDHQPVFRPDIPCETQEPPNLTPVSGGPGDAGEEVEPSGLKDAGRRVTERLEGQLDALGESLEALRKGERAPDPLIDGPGKGGWR
jgi:ABC-type transporter Mla subunit MlaD